MTSAMGAVKKPAEETAAAGAWAEAAAAGVDMELLEHNLKLTPWQRLIEHQRALELVEMLAAAKIRPDERPQQTAGAPDHAQG